MRIRKMTVTKRKKDVSNVNILRVRVARLSWSFVRSGTTRGDSVEGLDLVKNPIMEGGVRKNWGEWINRPWGYTKKRNEVSAGE